MIKGFIAFVVLSIASLFVLIIAPGPLSDKKVLLVATGSTYSTANKLHSEGVVYNKQIFWVVAQVMRKINKNNSVKAGEYLFEPHASLLSVIKKMQAGDVVIRKIVVPEGFTNKQIIELLQNAEGLKDTEGLKDPIELNYGEGSFLPETYFYTYGDTRAEILKRMEVAMATTVDELWAKRDQNIDKVIKNKSEAVILASIVEEEAKTEGDRGLIASVFLNRLKKGMRLEADPTVLYAVGKAGMTPSAKLTFKDLKVQSTFNTYVSFGLPPTPISNPGINSIKAVLNPIKTDHIFFVVADCNGKHNFARTLQEHNKNVQTYRKMVCKD